MSTAIAPSTTHAPIAIPEIDARGREAIGEEQARGFRELGLLVIRNLLAGEELARLRAETQALIDGMADGVDRPDFAFSVHEPTGRRVPCRIEYIIQHSLAARALMAHPCILRTVAMLQGPSFIPTWDAMVFKNPGAGSAVRWHRDAATDCLDPNHGGPRRQPVFNVDFYLDRADEGNCVWGIPGSNQWSEERAGAVCAELNEGGFNAGHGARPVTVEAGDVIIHDITTLHASAPTSGPLRRVLYYEFRPCDLELRRGPHAPGYIPLKQRVLQDCLRDRAATRYGAKEKPFVYAPESRFAPPAASGASCYRYPHQNHWRK